MLTLINNSFKPPKYPYININIFEKSNILSTLHNLQNSLHPQVLQPPPCIQQATRLQPPHDINTQPALTPYLILLPPYPRKAWTPTF